MAILSRDRHYLEYTPFITILCIMLLGGGLGVAIYYASEANYHTHLAVDNLYGATAMNLENVQPSIVGTSVCLTAVAVILLIMSFWRSLLEMEHDIRGRTSKSATAFLYLNGFWNTCLWLLVCWFVVMLMGATVWLTSAVEFIDPLNGRIGALTDRPVPPWYPGMECTLDCQNLLFISMVKANGPWTCFCSVEILTFTQTELQKVVSFVPAVMAGLFAMIVGGIGLGINCACQYSRTLKERQLLMTMSKSKFIGL